MVIYKVSITIDTEVQTEWLSWMMEEHIPEVLAAGYFTECKFYQVLEPSPTPEMVKFVVDYRCESVEKLRQYRENVAPELMNKHEERFHRKFTSAREVLAELKLHEGKVIF